MNPTATTLLSLGLIALNTSGCLSIHTGRSSDAPPPGAPAAAAQPAAQRPAPPPTHTVTRDTLKRTAQIDAVLESTTSHPLRLAPKAWMDFTVLEAAPHGTRVRQGDRLVRLDLEKIQDQIETLEAEQPAARIALEIAQAELTNLVASTPQKLEAARRSRRIAEEDLAYFTQTGRPQREKSTAMNLKGAQQRLENATEELRQLEKMYSADDLTEETEEIVLKRQKVDVEFAQFSLDSSRLNAQRELQTSLPREAESLQTQHREQALALDLAELNLPRTLTRKELEVAKMLRDRDKSDERLRDLKADLQAMDIRAPIDGLVVHGAVENGRWTTGPGVTKKLAPGGKLLPFEIFMTVVDPATLQLRAVIPEAEFNKLEVGATGEVSPVPFPLRTFPTRILSLDPIPLLTGGFDARLSVPAEAVPQLQPGLNCKVSFHLTAPSPTPLVPNDMIFPDGERKCVYIPKPDGGHSQAFIRTGNTDGKLTEILEGLKEGDRILTRKPE